VVRSFFFYLFLSFDCFFLLCSFHVGFVVVVVAVAEISWYWFFLIFWISTNPTMMTYFFSVDGDGGTIAGLAVHVAVDSETGIGE